MVLPKAVARALKVKPTTQTKKLQQLSAEATLKALQNDDNSTQTLLARLPTTTSIVSHYKTLLQRIPEADLEVYLADVARRKEEGDGYELEKEAKVEEEIDNLEKQLKKYYIKDEPTIDWDTYREPHPSGNIDFLIRKKWQIEDPGLVRDLRRGDDATYLAWDDHDVMYASPPIRRIELKQDLTQNDQHYEPGGSLCNLISSHLLCYRIAAVMKWESISLNPPEKQVNWEFALVTPESGSSLNLYDRYGRLGFEFEGHIDYSASALAILNGLIFGRVPHPAPDNDILAGRPTSYVEHMVGIGDSDLAADEDLNSD